MHPYLAALNARVLVFDGAMGTQLMDMDLTAADFGGARYQGCNEALVLTRPDLIRTVHDAYLAAGSRRRRNGFVHGVPPQARRIRSG